MDFVHDQLATGQKIRVLTVVDTFSRFSPVIDPRFSYRAEDVVATLEGACAATGYPKTIRVDQGSEFVAGTSISGPTRRASRWTSQGQANLPTVRVSVLPGEPDPPTD
jgi:transposase InsO family protein